MTPSAAPKSKPVPRVESIAKSLSKLYHSMTSLIYSCILHALENTKDSGSMPTENEATPKRKDITRIVKSPDMTSACAQTQMSSGVGR
jgi:hypothetical protein